MSPSEFEDVRRAIDRAYLGGHAAVVTLPAGVAESLLALAEHARGEDDVKDGESVPGESAAAEDDDEDGDGKIASMIGTLEDISADVSSARYEIERYMRDKSRKDKP